MVLGLGSSLNHVCGENHEQMRSADVSGKACGLGEIILLKSHEIKRRTKGCLANF